MMISIGKIGYAGASLRLVPTIMSFPTTRQESQSSMEPWIGCQRRKQQIDTSQRLAQAHIVKSRQHINSNI
jgi:hypothetical protein